MTLDEIKQALLPCFSKTLFTGPDTLFGSDTLKTVFDGSLPDSKLVIDGVLAQGDDAVTITGTGRGPFAGMSVVASFAPSDDDVSVVVTGTSHGSWSFGAAFPSLADSPLGKLAVLDGATLVLRTLPADPIPAGLQFQGSVSVAGPFLQVAKLVGSVPSLGFSGPITFTSGAPVFALKAPVTAPFSLGPLSNLGFTAVLNSDGTSGSMELDTTVVVNLANGQATLPAALKFGGASPVHLVVTAPKLGAAMPWTPGAIMDGMGYVHIANPSGVSIADLLPFGLGANLQALMPPPNLYDPSNYLSLDSIDFSIDPAKPALESVTFQLSSSLTWSIDSKVLIGGIAITLVVDNSSGKPKPSGTLTGTIAIGNQGSICTLDVTAAIPNATFSGTLDPNSNQPNVSDLVKYFLGDFGLPTITLSNLQFSATPSSSIYSISAGFTSDWSINIGEHGLAITGATVELDKGKDGLSGSIKGSLVLDQNNKFDAVYTLPGDFSISAQIPSIALSKVVAVLCKPLDITPPGFDFSLTDSTVLLQKTGSDYKFLLGTQLDKYGSAAFVVQDEGGTWRYAFGLDLAMNEISAVPALAALKVIDDVFGLDELLIIIGTITDAGFTFPALSEFDNPHITGKKISSGGWQKGLVVGLNIYALLDPVKSKALGWLCKLIGFSGTFATTVSVPFNPDNGTQLTASVSGGINSNMPISGAIVAKLMGETVSVGLQATIPTSIAGQKVTFTIEGDIEPNGVFLSGSTPDTITFVVVSLGGLAIELGVDDEGIPSIGFAGTIKVKDFDSSIAIFLNSANPAQSMFAGSISDVSLDQVLTPLIGLAPGSVPKPIVDVLNKFQVKGTAEFTIDGSLATALGDRNATPIITAFQDSSAHISLNPDPRNISILSGGSDSSWALTDLAAMAHYHLKKTNGTITVTKEVQTKFVPQATQIGNLPVVPAGYALSGELDVFGITGIVDIDIEPSVGLSIEASLSPVHLLNDHLLSITDDTDSSKGPFLSLSSYTKNGKPPHATAHGKVTLLGIVGSSIDIDISPSGASFELSSNEVVFSYDFKGKISGPTAMSAGGSAKVGLDKSLSLGILGSVSLKAQVGGTVAVKLAGKTASGSFSGSFDFQSTSFNVGPLKLDVNTASLANLAAAVAEEAANAVKDFLTKNLDPTVWLNWVKNNIIAGMLGNAAQIGKVLGGVFKQDAAAIANATHQVLGLGADATATALQAANVTADAAAKAMATVGFTATQIAGAIANAFKGIHADTHLPHVDIPGVHTDVSKHVDTPAQGHVDTQTPPHGDTHAHIDTPQGPHIDTGGGHFDHHQDAWGVGPHEDTGMPHVDSHTVPHGDTSPHVDSPSGPHVDGPVVPHLDTTPPHVDTTVPPHVDTAPHIDVKS